jgi:diguanylate cyclase (GGDEF)-like protein/PAS domain S-box-containing protein
MTSSDAEADDGPPSGLHSVDPPTPASDHALRSAFEEAPIGMAVLTLHGVVTRANVALGQLLGQAPVDLVGRTLFEVTHPDDLALARDSCAGIRTGLARVVRQECRFVLADGSVRWVLASTSRPDPVAGHDPHLVMHVEDVSDRKALEQELTRQALHDPLTGLPNRVLLLDRITHALARGERGGGPTCLFYLDLDGFKAVNDRHGHAVGDQVLQQLAHRLTRLLRPGDTAARLGGDEFAVLCEDTDTSGAALVAERLRAAAAVPYVLGALTVCLTAAVGLSSSHGQGSPEELLSRADLHMYEVKRG